MSEDFRPKALNQGWQILIEGYSDIAEGYLHFSRFNQTSAVIAWYPQNIEDHELISSKNALFDKELWSRQTESSKNLGDGLNVRLLEIVSLSGQKRFVLYWYQLDGAAYASNFKAKIYQAFDVMVAGKGSGALVALSLPFVELNRDETKQRLLEEAKLFAPKVVNALPF